MAGYTKADFYSLYSASPVCPETSRRYVEVRLHYHPALRARMGFKERAQKLINHCGIDHSSKVLLPGCGFGWLGEELIAQSGCECLGVEVSDYIFDTKDISADDELIDCLTGSRKCEFSYTEGIGKEIYDKFKDPSPRGKIPIIRGDFLSMTVDLGDFVPTMVITEDLMNALQEEDRVKLRDNLDGYGIPVYHMFDGAIA